MTHPSSVSSFRTPSNLFRTSKPSKPIFTHSPTPREKNYYKRIDDEPDNLTASNLRREGPPARHELSLGCTPHLRSRSASRFSSIATQFLYFRYTVYYKARKVILLGTLAELHHPCAVPVFPPALHTLETKAHETIPKE